MIDLHRLNRWRRILGIVGVWGGYLKGEEGEREFVAFCMESGSVSYESKDGPYYPQEEDEMMK